MTMPIGEDSLQEIAFLCALAAVEGLNRGRVSLPRFYLAPMILLLAIVPRGVSGKDLLQLPLAKNSLQFSESHGRDEHHEQEECESENSLPGTPPSSSIQPSAGKTQENLEEAGLNCGT